MELQDARMKEIEDDLDTIRAGLDAMDQYVTTVPEEAREATRYAFQKVMDAAMAKERLEVLPQQPPLPANHPIARWPELKNQVRKTGELYGEKNKVMQFFAQKRTELDTQSNQAA